MGFENNFLYLRAKPDSTCFLLFLVCAAGSSHCLPPPAPQFPTLEELNFNSGKNDSCK